MALFLISLQGFGDADGDDADDGYNDDETCLRLSWHLLSVGPPFFVFHVIIGALWSAKFKQIAKINQSR